MTTQHNRLRFDVETSRVLEILSKEIYDSPHALLRENVQNAYDAVLMRAAHEGTDLRSRSIRITFEGRQLRIEDDGIGMSEQVLSENFWKAGSSGKHTALAGRAGVIGTFGIGAMANFGVCTSLIVTTRDLRGTCTLVSRARRDQLRIAEECIDIERFSNGRNPGTTIEVELEKNSRLTPPQVRDYLATYVRFLPVAVTLNGTLISQQSFDAVYAKRVGEVRPLGFDFTGRRRVHGDRGPSHQWRQPGPRPAAEHCHWRNSRRRGRAVRTGGWAHNGIPKLLWPRSHSALQ